MSERVCCYVYDVTRGMARQIAPGLLGRPCDGIWHTAIVAYGGEYFFGSDGINVAPPGSITMLGSPNEIVELGDTAIPKEMFHEYLQQVGSDRFRGDRYHLTDHNCNNFSNEVGQFLTGQGIPGHILSMPHEILATPFGQMIKPMLDNMMNQEPSKEPSGVGGGGGESRESFEMGNVGGVSLPHFGTAVPGATVPPAASAPAGLASSSSASSATTSSSTTTSSASDQSTQKPPLHDHDLD